MRYPHFAEALRRLFGSYQVVMERFGVDRRTAFYYLAGRYVPRADKVVLYPDLLEALARDVEPAEQVAA